jgi:hypothetical protein
MMGDEFARDREGLGWTPNDVAVRFDVPARVARAWEDGTMSIPFRVSTAVAWWAATARAGAALRASGLPDCPVASDLLAWPSDRLESDPARRARLLLDHRAQCALCRQREKWAADHGEPMPGLPARGAIPGGVVDDLLERQRWYFLWHIEFVMLQVALVLIAYGGRDIAVGRWLCLIAGGACALTTGVLGAVGASRRAPLPFLRRRARQGLFDTVFDGVFMLGAAVACVGLSWRVARGNLAWAAAALAADILCAIAGVRWARGRLRSGASPTPSR